MLQTDLDQVTNMLVVEGVDYVLPVPGRFDQVRLAQFIQVMGNCRSTDLQDPAQVVSTQIPFQKEVQDSKTVVVAHGAKKFIQISN